jgi:eukaryotic-like serine/threonine-protein kinase
MDCGAHLALTIADGLISFGDDYLATWLGERFLQSMRRRLFSHVQKLSLDTLDRRRLGDVIARLTGDVQATGETLSHMVAVRDVRLSAAEVAHPALHLASAVRYLHGHGWLHLDLKPSNVIAECGRSQADRPGRGVPIRAGPPWGRHLPLHGARAGPGRRSGSAGRHLGSRRGAVRGGHRRAAVDDPDADELDSDEPYAESDEPNPNSDDGPTDESEYPHVQERARRADELRPMPAELADLIAACLEPEPGRRPGVAEVLRVLEPIAELPAAERRFA